MYKADITKSLFIFKDHVSNVTDGIQILLPRLYQSDDNGLAPQFQSRYFRIGAAMDGIQRISRLEKEDDGNRRTPGHNPLR